MKRNPADRILMMLKMRGKATSNLIAEELGITKEGVRKRLLNLATEGLVESEVKSEGVGRPSTHYFLTEKGWTKFPDTHSLITVQLLQSVRKLLGENAMELLISDRETNVYHSYEKAISKAKTIEQKLKILSQKRTEEGYMAEWEKKGKSYYLIEKHCPICAAATECQGFCRSELSTFRRLIGPEYTVQRTEYIIEGSNRCVYKIEKIVQH